LQFLGMQAGLWIIVYQHTLFHSLSSW
jgi:hypothetical protein